MGSNFHGGNKKKDKMLLDMYVRNVVPRIYAALACELWDRGWDAETIEQLFADSQARWQDSAQNGWDMLKNVEEVTGIKVEYFKKTGNIV